MCIPFSRKSLPHVCGPEAQADIAILANGTRELHEAAVFLGDDESLTTTGRFGRFQSRSSL
jgi:hypothetical protein